MLASAGNGCTALLLSCLPGMQVLGTVWVNEHVSTADTIVLEVAQRGLQGISINWDEAGQRWQASIGNPASSHAGVRGVIMEMMYCASLHAVSVSHPALGSSVCFCGCYWCVC
jgi:hypothetical protein